MVELRLFSWTVSVSSDDVGRIYLAADGLSLNSPIVSRAW